MSQEPFRRVEQWYFKYLNRAGDIPSIGHWTHQILLTGIAAALSDFLSCEPGEYWQKCGGTPEHFVTFLFLDTWGRGPTTSEFRPLVNGLHDGSLSRQTVAYAVVSLGVTNPP